MACVEDWYIFDFLPLCLNFPRFLELLLDCRTFWGVIVFEKVLVYHAFFYFNFYRNRQVSICQTPPYLFLLALSSTFTSINNLSILPKTLNNMSNILAITHHWISINCLMLFRLSSLIHSPFLQNGFLFPFVEVFLGYFRFICFREVFYYVHAHSVVF